jgi:hypothetical protein
MESNSDAPATAPAAAVPAERKEKKRRRTQSDPGEQPTAASPRQLRVRAPKPTQPDRKKRKEAKEAAIMALLDETHRRRMEALGEAVEAAATSQ